jgi:hypothetical protein
VAHRQWESFPSEPAPEMIKAVICVDPATTTTTNNDAAAAELLLNWPKSHKQIAILFYFISSRSLPHYQPK